MVKDTKRKPTMEKITKPESAATTYTKRTYGLHSKVAQLCLITDAQIAVLATPPSANSNVSFFSFGHTSVDSIVNAYLKGGKPVREEIDDHEDLGICLARKELGLPQWWESDRLLNSKDPEELSRAMNSVLRLQEKIKELRAEDADDHVSDDEQQPPLKKKKKSHSNETMEKKTEQTLVLPSGPSEEGVKTLDSQVPLEYNNVLSDEELARIMSTCDSLCVPDNNNNNNNDLLDMDFYQLIDPDCDFDFDSLNSSHNSETMKMAEPVVDQPLILPSGCCAPPHNNTFSSSGGEKMSSEDYEIDNHQQLSDFDMDTSSEVFLDESLLESTESAMNSLYSVDGVFVEISTSTVNGYASSDVNDEDSSLIGGD